MVAQVATLDILTERAHFDPDVARAVADAIEMQVNSSLSTLATKQDVSDLRSEFKQEISELRSELKQDHAELRTDFERLRSEIKQDHAELRTDFERLRSELKHDHAELRTDFEKHRASVNRSILELRSEFVEALSQQRSELRDKLADQDKTASKNKIEVIRWVVGTAISSISINFGIMYFMMQNMR